MRRRLPCASRLHLCVWFRRIVVCDCVCMCVCARARECLCVHVFVCVCMRVCVYIHVCCRHFCGVTHLRGHDFVARVAGICTLRPLVAPDANGASCHSGVDWISTELAGVRLGHLIAVHTESVSTAHHLHNMKVAVRHKTVVSRRRWGLSLMVAGAKAQLRTASDSWLKGSWQRKTSAIVGLIGKNRPKSPKTVRNCCKDVRNPHRGVDK